MVLLYSSEKDATQLLHAYTFINDLCTDSNLRGFVLTYPNFATALNEVLKVIYLLPHKQCKLTLMPSI